jgi:hypothetical protein
VLEAGKIVANIVIGYDSRSPKNIGNQNIERFPRTDSIDWLKLNPSTLEARTKAGATIRAIKPAQIIREVLI